MTTIDLIRYAPPLSTAAIGLGLLATGVVSTAWVFELYGFTPCQLCLWQRIPYYVAAPLLVFAGLLGFNGFSSFVRAALALVGLIFVVSTGLAVYHSGVEWGFWAGPTTCAVVGGGTASDATNLLESLAASRPPSCTEAAGRFLGLSFAGWNVVASAGLAAACFFAARAATSNNLSNT